MPDKPLRNPKAKLKIAMAEIKVIIKNHPVFASLFICMSFSSLLAAIWFVHLLSECAEHYFSFVLLNNAFSANYNHWVSVPINVALSMGLLVGFCKAFKAATNVFLRLVNIRRSDADVSS